MLLISGTHSGRRIRVQIKLLSLGIAFMRLFLAVFLNRVEGGKGSGIHKLEAG